MTDKTDEPTYNAELVERAEFNKVGFWLPTFALHFIRAGLNAIDGKTFTDCVIEGPAVMLAMGNVTFEDCNLGVTTNPRNLLVQGLGERMTGAIGVSNTRFVRCRFVGVGFSGHPDFLAGMEATLNAHRAAQSQGDQAQDGQA